MANPGDAAAADVPGRFDVVIDGKGYVLADSIESSLPFRTHRAIYDISPTFVERTNTTNVYGDQAQDFFLTASQNDWSLGEGRKFFRLSDEASKSRYWVGSNVDVSIPGQVKIQQAVSTISFSSAVIGGCGSAYINNKLYVVDSTNLYSIDGAGTKTDLGAHGAGTPYARSVISDGNNIYIGGGTALRRYSISGATFSSFVSATYCALAFVSNTLFAVPSTMGEFGHIDTGGTYSTLYNWDDATGTARGVVAGMRAYGGGVLVLRSTSEDYRGAELWQYDGSTQKIATFPPNFRADTVETQLGIAFVSGCFITENATKYQPAVFYYANGTTGLMWKAATSSSNLTVPPITAYRGGLVFTDETTGNFMYYDIAAGGVSTIGSFTAGSVSWTNSTGALLFASGTAFAHSRNSTSLYFFPSTSAASSASVTSSLIDFDSSLTKLFRGVIVHWEAASDGDGGSVDISYQTDSVDNAYTSLTAGAVSGTEYTFAASTTGKAISIKVTLNKGTSTSGPTLKRVYVRAAPLLSQFKSGLYILDCTGTPDAPRQLRDGTYHPLTGYEQVQNLLSAAQSTTPFSVTDKVNGTFTGLIDLQDSEGWDVYEVHPNPDNPNKPGAYLVRLKVREV